jgi:hypothetical protein
MGRRTISPGDGDPAHGTPNGYSNLRCHCDECKRAWADYSCGRRQIDPRRTKVERLAKRKREDHPDPDPEEEPYVFSRPPVKRTIVTGEARLALSDEKLLPWMTERLVVLDYDPDVKAFRDGGVLVVRCALALMPSEVAEKGWADQVVAEAVEWARGDPRLATGA